MPKPPRYLIENLTVTGDVMGRKDCTLRLVPAEGMSDDAYRLITFAFNHGLKVRLAIDGLPEELRVLEGL